ncbi:MAG: hypothetical protein J0M24_03245 [Verrucomicrobia bacterium]|nr:hypothetical protein [Verrucomicrobiota bacterium]
MAADLARPPFVDQPWLRDFLEAKGFRRTAPDAFGNGRATLRFTGTNLLAIPAGGGKAWRSELNEAPPEAIRNVLEALLSTPSFQSAAELQRREDRRQAAEASLAVLTDAIAQHPDTHRGVHLRRFLWSLYNGHHALNLWRLKDVLDHRHNAAVVEVFTAWMQGHVSEDALRHALTVSGEMDRWEAATLGPKDRERLDDALNAVTDLLNTVPPGRPILELTRANGLLRQVVDCLRTAKK